MLKAISLFTGIGGLDFGFEAAGFKTVAAVESDPVCCASLRLNRRISVIESDIAKVSSKTLLKIAGIKRGEADVLIGGPPCQPFSKSAYWLRGDSARLKDPRARTLIEYLRVLEDTLPKTFLLENVPGLAFRNKDEGLHMLLRGIKRINKRTGANYAVSWKLLNAADFGVPQLRSRLILVGNRNGNQFIFPNPTHGDSGLIPYRTAWDAIGDLQERRISESCDMGGRWADLLPSIPEGGNYLWHTPRGGGMPLFGWRTRYWNFLLKLAKGQPSWTIVANTGPANGPFHWDNRRLTIRELCRLQTFPDGLQFRGSYKSSIRMIGNAVPSLLAEVIAREIRCQFLNSRRVSGKPKLLPPKRRSIPRADAITRVPQKYFSLKGDHAEHPGVGLGPGSRKLKRQRARGAEQVW